MKTTTNLVLMSLMMVLMAGIVYGADPTCTFDQTATTAGTSNTYIRGATQNLSVTITNPGEGEGNNATMGIITVGSGTITGALTFNTTDGTNNSYINTTVNTLALSDDTSYTFTMTMYNESQNTIGTACTRDYITDNTIPVLTLTSPTDLSIDTDGVVPFNYGCVNTSSATLFIEDKSYTMTESSDVCTYTNPLTSKLTNGFQSWYITASDGLNITTSSTTQVEVRKPGGLIDESTQIDTTTTTTTPTSKLSGPLGMIIVLAIIWYAIKGRKKK